ncbi:MAG: glycosyltransferase family 2 protein [bacterium]|nr:glycosyltransferase family 2 protein [bacterium]
MPQLLSVVIPAYNEATRIKETILKCSSYLIDKHLIHEIIVVDDGSTDKTVDVVQEIIKTLSNLILVKLQQNKGKGAAVQYGMEVAIGDVRLFMDADGSTPIEEIERLLPLLESYDIIIGSRALNDSRVKRSQSWYRQLFGKFGNIIVRLLFGLQLYDTQCGFKLFNKRSAEFLFPKLILNRFGFDIEILALGNKYGLKIKEVPVTWEHKENSKVNYSDYIDVLISILKVKYRMLTGKYK